MRKSHLFLLVAVMLFFALFVRSVTAQGGDADNDRIKDEFDMCPNTPSPDLLPIIRNNPEFYGCSCAQIYEKLGDSSLCYNIYCLAGRPLSMSKRLSTSDIVSCGPDYCEGETLYEFPEPDFAQCVDGKIVEDFCKPKITLTSEFCISGVVPQKAELPLFDIEITGEQIIPKEKVVVDYYQVVQQNPELRLFLDNPSRSEFIYASEKTYESVTVSRVVSRKRVGNTDATIPYVSIIIKPIEGKELKNVVVFENLELNYRADAFVFYGEQPIKIVPTREFVWLVDSLSEEGVTINYQVNEPVEIPGDTYVVGAVKRKSFLADWWPLLLIPIFGYFAYRYITSSNKD